MFRLNCAVLLVASFICLAEAYVIVKDPCWPNPCGRRGKCHITIINETSVDFSCRCAKGRAGRRCHIRRPREWLYKKCTWDINCLLKIPMRLKHFQEWHTDPICFRGQCLCYPGYFYSVSQRICVKNCSPQDLQDTFIRYPGARTVQNIDNVFQGNVEQCQAICSHNPECTNFEIVSGMCFSSQVQGSNAGLIGARKWDYYQRKCI